MAGSEGWGIATSGSLKESGINRQFQQGGRKCKFPANWKEEKRIRARTPERGYIE